MKTLRDLQMLQLQWSREKRPSIPDHARKLEKYTDKTANGLTKCIVDFCKFTPKAHAERTSNEGRVIDGRKTYTDAIGRKKTIGDVKRIPSSGTLGTSDIKACINGRFVAIEVKMKDSQSDKQKEYQQMIEEAGGDYWIVRSFSDFLDRYYEFINIA